MERLEHEDSFTTRSARQADELFASARAQFPPGKYKVERIALSTHFTINVYRRVRGPGLRLVVDNKETK